MFMLSNLDFQMISVSPRGIAPASGNVKITNNNCTSAIPTQNHQNSSLHLLYLAKGCFTYSVHFVGPVVLC
jgi:hypothetical protein